ncbi:MAG: UDP-N-acetylmuramoyl-L-alanine--D-glutamate ligase [Gemmatimonadales bacterium]|nr:UDP-N-acetylmuramoyl-L-alanine--D-glutamate ligase [Gemmatimonadales bacterium]
MSLLERWALAGREVVVAGLGRSGLAATRLLHARGIPVHAVDDGTGDALGQQAALLADLDRVTTQVGGHDPARVAGAAALVLSPGIPPTAAIVRTARTAGVPVVSEAQLGLDALAGVPTIVVTGTNGKTTTTALVHHLLSEAGRRSAAAGNIGTALSAVALQEQRPDWLAVELSSFQLHDCPELAPTIGILTNLSPDHLDRYQSLDEYYADKARLFANATDASIWISNLDDPESRRMVAGVAGRHLTFSVVEEADAWRPPRLPLMISWKTPGGHVHQSDEGDLLVGGQRLMPRRKLPLLGDHNVANALAAALAVNAAGVPLETIAAGLGSFRAMPHRLEPVRTVDGVLWINDSKATNVASTLVAIKAMARPAILLLGGRHKGEPYTVLREAIREHCGGVVTYGEAGDLAASDLQGISQVVRVETLEQAIAEARTMVATPGGAVLLSPACSSYDQFPNYEVRGATFRAMVEAL